MVAELQPLSVADTPPLPAGRRRVGRLLRRCRPHSKLEAYGLLVLGLVLLVVVGAPFVTAHDPISQDMAQQLRPPSFDHLLGTDQFGRDIFSRVIYGGRVSIAVSVAVVVMGAAVGITFGAIAGYAGGIVDEVLMRIADIFLAFPPILLALVVVGALGPGILTTAIAIAVAWWPVYARVVRGEILSVRERDYVVAARTIGVPGRSILIGTVMPNSMGPLRLILVQDVGYAMIATATLSFLGMGMSPPNPEWGSMIREALVRPGAWWLFVGPGAAIVLFVSALNFYGSVVTRSPDQSP